MCLRHLPVVDRFDCRPTMFRRIRIRAGSANFNPHNTSSVLPKHTRQTLPFQSVVVLVVVSTTSYADPHNSTSVRRFKVHPADCEHPQSAIEDMNIHHRCLDVTVQPVRSFPLSLFRRWPSLPFTARVLSIPHYMFKGSLVDPRLRASNEHILIVRVPRAGGRLGCPSYPSQGARSGRTGLTWVSFLLFLL